LEQVKERGKKGLTMKEDGCVYLNGGQVDLEEGAQDRIGGLILLLIIILTAQTAAAAAAATATE